MPEAWRRRAPLVVAVALLVVVAVVLVQRGRASSVSAPFELATEGRALQMVEAAEDYYEVDVFLGDVCAPDSDDVRVTDVALYGVDGSLHLTGFRPRTITVDCAADDPEAFVVQVRRVRGESANADGVDVTYESDGRVDRVRLPSSMTLCRQLAEC